MILALLVLAFTLSLDNFRASIALGTLPQGWVRTVQFALVFGLWDGVAPLVGLVLGHYFGRAIGPVAGYVGPTVLGVFGLYLLVQALRTAAPEEPNLRWALFGIPLSLSLDNILAGAGVGILGFSPWLSAGAFAASTALMSFVGLQLGRVAARLIRIRWDLLSGVALVIMAVVLAVE